MFIATSIYRAELTQEVRRILDKRIRLIKLKCSQFVTGIKHESRIVFGIYSFIPLYVEHREKPFLLLMFTEVIYVA